MSVCAQYGGVIQYVSQQVQDDKRVVLVACEQDASALQYASLAIQNTKEVVLQVCSQDGTVLQYASPELQSDEEVVLVAYSQENTALQYALREPVLKLCSKDGLALRHASCDLQNDKEVVLMACSKAGMAIEYASCDLQNDKEVVLMACSKAGMAIEYASEQLRSDRDVVLQACSQDGLVLQLAPDELKQDKDVVLAACSQNGDALRSASETLRSDKKVVLAAAKSNPGSLKFALGGLNQDKDCLICAKLWDENYVDRNAMKVDSNADRLAQANKKKIVLSTKFSLAAESSAHATRFTVEFKGSPYITNGNFLVYSPNAFNKDTCDPKWTDKNWPCRGTFSSCQKPSHLKAGVPQEGQCCWRYSFRYQLKEAFSLDGIMIQVVDWNAERGEHILGDGQRIEREMAQDIGIKTFRFFEPLYSYAYQVGALVSKIEEWYEDGCSDMTECNVTLGKLATLPD